MSAVPTSHAKKWAVKHDAAAAAHEDDGTWNTVEQPSSGHNWEKAQPNKNSYRKHTGNKARKEPKVAAAPVANNEWEDQPRSGAAWTDAPKKNYSQAAAKKAEAAPAPAADKKKLNPNAQSFKKAAGAKPLFNVRSSTTADNTWAEQPTKGKEWNDSPKNNYAKAAAAGQEVATASENWADAADIGKAWDAMQMSDNAYARAAKHTPAVEQKPKPASKGKKSNGYAKAAAAPSSEQAAENWGDAAAIGKAWDAMDMSDNAYARAAKHAPPAEPKPKASKGKKSNGYAKAAAAPSSEQAAENWGDAAVIGKAWDAMDMSDNAYARAAKHAPAENKPAAKGSSKPKKGGNGYAKAAAAGQESASASENWGDAAVIGKAWDAMDMSDNAYARAVKHAEAAEKNVVKHEKSPRSTGYADAVKHVEAPAEKVRPKRARKQGKSFASAAEKNDFRTKKLYVKKHDLNSGVWNDPDIKTYATVSSPKPEAPVVDQPVRDENWDSTAFSAAKSAAKQNSPQNGGEYAKAAKKEGKKQFESGFNWADEIIS